jgi:hypothetical protein
MYVNYKELILFSDDSRSIKEYCNCFFYEGCDDESCESISKNNKEDNVDDMRNTFNLSAFLRSRVFNAWISMDVLLVVDSVTNGNSGSLTIEVLS